MQANNSGLWKDQCVGYKATGSSKADGEERPAQPWLPRPLTPRVPKVYGLELKQSYSFSALHPGLAVPAFLLCGKQA